MATTEFLSRLATQLKVNRQPAERRAVEKFLHLVAEKLGLEPVFFTREQLNAKGVRSPANPVVEKYTGAVGVSEPSAMLAAGADDLVLAKRKSRRATLAVARKAFA